ncbi:MAG: formylglycine-generating enzyme family protein [Candidatus Thorarchaeota archaeon]|jgi:iron(II)-dependent oxidoreductase
MMGSDSGDSNEQPVHEVAVQSFEMTKSEVTVSQYRVCVDAGFCVEPSPDYLCNWEAVGTDDHPINCIDWDQASRFCQCAGGRLPSEAEWEYAARGGGQDILYPWGNEDATCEYAVMYDVEMRCGTERTWPVCSKTAGNTQHGLCDMAGNVWEWIRDSWHDNYQGAPIDGSAWDDPPDSNCVLRGASMYHPSYALRATYRSPGITFMPDHAFGIRCVR